MPLHAAAGVQQSMPKKMGRSRSGQANYVRAKRFVRGERFSRANDLVGPNDLVGRVDGLFVFLFFRLAPACVLLPLVIV